MREVIARLGKRDIQKTNKLTITQIRQTKQNAERQTDR